MLDFNAKRFERNSLKILCVNRNALQKHTTAAAVHFHCTERQCNWGISLSLTRYAREKVHSLFHLTHSTHTYIWCIGAHFHFLQYCRYVVAYLFILVRFIFSFVGFEYAFAFLSSPSHNYFLFLFTVFVHSKWFRIALRLVFFAFFSHSFDRRKEEKNSHKL